MNAGDTLLQRYRVLARHALEFSPFASNAADAGCWLILSCLVLFAGGAR